MVVFVREDNNKTISSTRYVCNNETNITEEGCINYFTISANTFELLRPTVYTNEKASLFKSFRGITYPRIAYPKIGCLHVTKIGIPFDRFTKVNKRLNRLNKR